MDNLRNFKLDQLSTKDYDLHQRRITNAAPSVKRTDYVIKKELLDALDFKELEQDLVFSGVISFKRAVSFLSKVIFYKAISFVNGASVNNITSNDDTVALDIAADTITITPGTKLGFWGAAAATKQTLAAYVSNNQSISYIGIASGIGGTPYAQASDLDNLRIAYQNLKTSYDDLRTKLENTTLVG